jgi:acetate---CoA ligase (ADP-forming)
MADVLAGWLTGAADERAGLGEAGAQEPTVTGAAREPTVNSAALERLLKPSSVAIVGLSDNNPLAALVLPTLDSDAEVFFVNPRYDTVLGRPAAPSLTSLGRPVDAVMSFMSSVRTTELVEEAAGLDVGGVVLITSGFAETGPEGKALQERIRLAAASSGMAVIGPNGLGYVNVRRGISLTIAGRHKRRPGGISVVSHSGAMLSGVAMAAWQYDGCGLNVIVSAGNEAHTDLADYVGYLAGDPETTAIGLIIEKVRRPAEFFAAVRRATEAGKPVVALKLARNARSQRMAASHTGALTGDAWVYDVALRQAGVALAYDPEELVDRLALFDQVPRSRWTPVRALGIVTLTGGFASLAVDLAAAEGVEVPALESFGEWVRTNLPGITVPNPLDTTGLGGQLWPQIVDRYAASDELDSLLVIHPVAEEDEDLAPRVVKEYTRAAAEVAKPCVLANCSGVPGSWAKPLVGDIVALGRGLRPSIRGLQTLGAFVRYREALRAAPDYGPRLPRPAPSSGFGTEGLAGEMLPFADTMRLLADVGIPVAPHAIVPPDAEPTSADVPFAGPYVAKLADVAHRTEHGAVRLNVGAAGLPAAITGLRELAARDGLPEAVAVQPMIAAAGEAFLGIQGESELGPLVVFGLGGIFAEALRRVGGRMAPFGYAQARELIEEFRDVRIMHGFRGQPPWDLGALASILVAASRLAAGGRDWIASLDVNPLLFGPDGFQAVDALLLVRPA